MHFLPEYTSCVTSLCAHAEVHLQDRYLSDCSYKLHAHANRSAVHKCILLLSQKELWHLFELTNTSSAKAG